MARTDKFRAQHDELLTLASDLQATLNESQLAVDASASRSVLSKLMGKLTMHLAAEDKVLYPDLQSSSDPAVVGLAKRFADEMSGVAPTVVAFNEKWATPSAIKANPASFIAETKNILGVLGNRINRENRELYAAADRMS